MLPKVSKLRSLRSDFTKLISSKIPVPPPKKSVSPGCRLRGSTKINPPKIYTMKTLINSVLIAFAPFLGWTQINGIADYVREVPSLEQEYYKGLIKIDTTENKNLDEYWFIGEPTISGIQTVIKEAQRILELNYLTFSEPQDDVSELSEKINYSFADQIFNLIENVGEVVILIYYIPDYRLNSDLIWVLQFYADQNETSVYIFQL